MARAAERPERPPTTRTVDQVDSHHGTTVADPYRWLEAASDSPEMVAFLADQNAYAASFLATMPEREALRERLTELWNRPRFGTPFERGGRAFQFRNSGLQNQDVLCLLDGDGGVERTLFDPNELGTDGTAALVATSVSPDGSHLAYAISRAGSDWRTWRVREIESGVDLADTLHWSKFAGATWLPDGSGFYYVGYPTPNAGAALLDATLAPEVRLHLLGSDQSTDATVYADPAHPKRIVWPDLSHDGRDLLIATRSGSSGGNGVLRARPGGGFDTLVSEGDDRFSFLGRSGDELLFWTDRAAPKGCVVATNPDLDGAPWRTVVAEGAHVLDVVRLVGDELVLAELRDACHALVRFDLVSQRRREVELPGLWALHGGNEPNPLLAERFAEAVTFSVASFLTPPTPYRLHLGDGRLEQLARPPLGLDPEAYGTERQFARSRDGTRIPMFVTRRRDLATGRAQPTLLYGYGGFGVNQTPTFQADRLAWLERGGVFVSTVLRGGGEYGADWHDAGRLDAKQAVFDDFIACAETLIDRGVCDRSTLAIEGRSNGGLLVGACLTQRPELFAAALPAVGVFDMLRYHLFTIGWAWASDYGTADDPEQFRALLAYSPLHNVRPGVTYPATMITTADHDDRVVPAHSFKFAAALQAAQAGPAPVLLRVESGAGHGLGTPTTKLIEAASDRYAFLAMALGVGR